MLFPSSSECCGEGSRVPVGLDVVCASELGGLVNAWVGAKNGGIMKGGHYMGVPKGPAGHVPLGEGREA